MFAVAPIPKRQLAYPAKLGFDVDTRFCPKKGMASGVVLSRNNQTQQNLFKFGFLSPVLALPALLRVLACTAVQSAPVGASCLAAGVGMYGGAIGPCARFLPCYGCWHVR